MEKKRAFATQSLVIIVLFNAVLLAIVYGLGGGGLREQAAIVFGAGLVVTLLLWFVLLQVAGRHIGSAAAVAPPVEAPRPAPIAPPPPAPPALPPTTAAVQLLSLLQRKGRLIDFLQEDLRRYDDAQIGAAVRSVHEGCREALAEHITLEPILDVPEGSTTTVPPGFDARTIRLTGNVVGSPPFKGEVRHRGWRVKQIDLPALMPGQAPETVVAAAEVEV